MARALIVLCVLCTRVGPKTADAQRLLLISEHVLAIRQGQQGDDYVGAVQAAVKAIDSNVFSVGKMPVDAVCIAEVECARAEVNYHIVVDSCLRGLAEGAICGPVGAIAVKSISTRQLADAILLTQGLNVNTVKSRFLLSTAEALLSLRRAVQEVWHSYAVTQLGPPPHLCAAGLLAQHGRPPCIC